MRIESVVLRNIKSYREVRVDFTEGVNAIVGHNGAGKSTLLEAIGFVLFDSLDYTQPNFIRQGEGEGSVVVTFESDLDGRLYRAVRTIGAGAGQSIFDVELDAKLCSGAADVPIFLRQHFGVSQTTEMSQLFHDAVGVPQGALTAIFLQSHAVRKKVFDPLLRVEEYQQAYERLREAKNLLAARIAEADVEIARLQGVLQRLPDLRARAAAIVTERASASAELDGTRVDLVRIGGERARLETQKEKLQQLEQQREDVRREIAAADARREAAARQLDEAERAHAIVLQHQQGHDAYLGAQQDKQILDGRLLERQKLEIEKERASAQGSQARERIRMLDAELAQVAAAQDRIATLEPAVQEQGQLEARRLELQRDVAQLGAAQQQLSQSARTLAEEQAQLQSMQRLLLTLPEISGQIASTEARARELQAQVETLQQRQIEVRAEGLRYKAHDGELEKLTDVELCPVCLQPLAPGHLESLRHHNEQERARLRDVLRGITAGLASLQEQIAETESAKSAAEGRRRLIPAEAAVDALAQRVDAYAAKHESTRRLVDQLAGAPTELAQVEARLRELGNPRGERDQMAAQVARRGALETSRAQAATESASATEAETSLGQALQAYDGLDGRLAAAAAALARHLDAYQKVLSNRQAASALPQRRDEEESAVKALEALQVRFASAEQAAADALASFDAAAYAAASGEEARLQGMVGRLTMQLEMLTNEKRTLDAEIAALDGQQSALDALQAGRARLTLQDGVLDKLRNVIKNAGPHITRALIVQISDQAAQIFGELTGDFTRRLRWNEDFSIALEVDGRDREFKSLSGGEQMVAALAVRLALLREMSTIDIAFFDEPTAHLDAVRREALASQILAVKGFRQIFVISHDDTFERATHNLIHVERVDGASQLVER